MQLPATLIDELLACWPVGRLATLRPSGPGDRPEPHLLPIVFVPFAGALWSPIDGKRKATSTLQREHNVTHNPQISLLLDDYQEDWQLLWWLRLDGCAEVVNRETADPGAPLDSVYEALHRKYSQYGQQPGGAVAAPPGATTSHQPGSKRLLRLTIRSHHAWAQRDPALAIEQALQQRR